MTDIFSWTNMGNLMVLIFLQVVLGFDNLLYISLESKRAPKKDQSRVRKIGITMALVLRVVLLFVMLHLIDALQAPFFEIHWTGILEGAFNFSTIVFLIGGVFLMYTAVKEVTHLLSTDDLSKAASGQKKKTPRQVIGMIVLMNLIFSFDSILSAVAITKVFAVLATAIAVSGIAMLVLADRVAEFLNNNKKYEVLGLFILLIVGVVLLGEGGHVAHLKIFSFSVEPMAKTTFYFAIFVLVCVDVLQSGYQKKLGQKKLA